jgi:alpha-1,2-mannosyltransferase
VPALSSLRPPLRDPLRTAALGGVLLGIGAVVWYFVAKIEPLDLLVFLRAGDAVLAGGNPYPADLASPEVYSHSAFVYPYLAAWPFAPLAALPTVVATTLFAVASVAAVTGAWALAGQRNPATLALVALSSVAIIGFQMGTLNALFLLALVAAWRFRDRAVAVGLIVAVLVVAKLFLVPLIAWLVLSRRWKAAAYAVGTAGSLLVAGWLLGPIGMGDYLEMVSLLAEKESVQSSSLAGRLAYLGTPFSTAQLVAYGAGLLVIGVGFLLARWRGAEEITYAACVVGALLATPIVWNHYLLLLAAPLLVAGAGTGTFAVFFALSWLIVIPHHTEKIPWVTDAVWAFADGDVRHAGTLVLLLVVVGYVAVRTWRASRPVSAPPAAPEPAAAPSG